MAGLNEWTAHTVAGSISSKGLSWLLFTPQAFSFSDSDNRRRLPSFTDNIERVVDCLISRDLVECLTKAADTGIIFTDNSDDGKVVLRNVTRLAEVLRLNKAPRGDERMVGERIDDNLRVEAENGQAH